MIREYIVAENQHKNYSFLIDETHVVRDMHIRFYVERNAFVVVEFLIARATMNIHVECVLQGEGADAHITGLYMVDQAHKVTVTTVQHHRVAHTRSALIMKGMLHDNAHAHYHGIVRIEKEAHGSCASQENKNMLLSNNARAVSVPSLEVLTHDVHCSHGSAIGRFDDEKLFYAAARGIDEKAAEWLFLQAFCADLFIDEKLKERMNILLKN